MGRRRRDLRSGHDQLQERRVDHASPRSLRLARRPRSAQVNTRFRSIELHERIGIGGMAEVFRATAVLASGAQQTIVVKRILPALSAEPQYQQMFNDEVRV